MTEDCSVFFLISEMKLYSCLLIVILVNPAFLSELKIVSTPDGSARPQECAMCWCFETQPSWLLQLEESPWTSFNQYFNITECGFVSKPVVTVSLKGPDCPSICISASVATYFSVLTLEDVTSSQMVNSVCDVYWSAFGYKFFGEIFTFYFKN